MKQRQQQQRGRNRRPGHQSNRALESTGPDLKVRGPAAVIYEKYQQLARDAASAGDRIMAENYAQHAEHYYRLLRAQMPTHAPVQHQQDRYGQEEEYEGEEEGFEGGEAGEQPEMGAGEGREEGQGFEGQRPEGQRYEGQRYEGQGGEGYREGGNRFNNRRRNRRNRFRPEGGDQPRPEGGFEGREGASREPYAEGPREHREARGEFQDNRGERVERAPRPERVPDAPEPRAERPERGPRPERSAEAARGPRRERGPRNGPERTDEGPPEGFGGQAPAFLGSD